MPDQPVTITDAEAFADFMSFGFRASDDPTEPGLLDVVGAFLLGSLSRSERWPLNLDRDKPRECEKMLRAQAGRWPHVPTGRPGSEMAGIGKAYNALADLYAMRCRVRRAGPEAFDAREAARLRRVAWTALNIAACKHARLKAAA